MELERGSCKRSKCRGANLDVRDYIKNDEMLADLICPSDEALAKERGLTSHIDCQATF